MVRSGHQLHRSGAVVLVCCDNEGCIVDAKGQPFDLPALHDLAADIAAFPGAFTICTGRGVPYVEARSTTGEAARFTDDERAAIKEHAQESKTAVRRGSRAIQADGEGDVLAKIAEMPRRSSGR
jgi:hypothetical protein